MMNFLKRILSKPKISFVIGIILGMILTATGVYAATTFNSKSVFYDNTNSSLSSANVQDAIDELYKKASSCLEEPSYYASGMPTESSPTDFKEVVSSSGSSTFVRKQGNQLSVCLYSSATNNKLICLKNSTDNYEENKAILNTTNFPGATCDSTSSNAHCSSDSFYCYAHSDGNVNCCDNGAGLCCIVSADGSAASCV